MCEKVNLFWRCKCGEVVRSPIQGVEESLGNMSNIIANCRVQCPKCQYENLMSKMDIFYYGDKGEEKGISFATLEQ